jgi:hypothetical protein
MNIDHCSMHVSCKQQTQFCKHLVSAVRARHIDKKDMCLFVMIFFVIGGLLMNGFTIGIHERKVVVQSFK